MNAEQSVIGAILLKPESFWQVADLIGEADFTNAHSRMVFAAIREMLSAGKVVDALTVADHDKRLNAVDLIDIVSGTHSAANVRGYAEIVAKEAEQRRLSVAATRIAKAESFGEAQRILASVAPKTAAKLVNAKEAAQAMWERLQERYEHGEGLRGISSGVASLDEYTGGFRGGQLVIIAGRPGMGKTTQVLQTAKSGGRCLVFSLEMTAGELMERMLSNTGNIPLNWLKFPKDHDEALFGDGSLSIKIAALKNLPILIDDRSYLTLDQIVSAIRQQHMVEPLNSVIIDHIGLIKLPGKGRHDLEVGEVTHALKALAKELDIPVIALCQLNRGVEERADKRPMLSDLRNSGDIEQDADVVIMMFRPEYYRLEPAGYVEFIVAKQRDGETGSAWAESRLSMMQFVSCPPPVVEAPKPNNVRGFGR